MVDQEEAVTRGGGKAYIHKYNVIRGVEGSGRLSFLRGKAFRYGAVVVLLGIIFRAIISRFIFFQPDEEIYSYDAWELLMGSSLLEVKTRVYIGYSGSLAVWMKMFGISLLSARLFTVFCYAGIILFTYLTVLRITKSERSALIVGLLIALLPFPLRYGYIVLSEPFSWLFISLSIYLLILGFQKDRWFFYLLSGLAITVAASGRRSALVIPLVLIPSLIWIHRGDLKKMIRSTVSWVAGFGVPLAAGVGGFLLYFGVEAIKESKWNYTPDFTVISVYDNAFFTLQPTVLKAGPLALLLLVGTFILLCSIFRNRWKAVYLACVLWPAFVQISLDMHASNLQMTLISLSPAIMLIAMGRRYMKDHQAFLAVSLMFGSSIAFNNSIITGSIWNVIIYLSVGALVLLYLEDRVTSRLMTPLLMIGGLVLLGYSLSKEEQIRDLVMLIAPITGLCYSLSLTVSKAPPRAASHTLISLMAVILTAGYYSGSLGDTEYMLCFLGIIIGVGIYAVEMGGKRDIWTLIRYGSGLVGLLFFFLIPSSASTWMVLLPVALIFPLAMVSQRDLRLPRKYLFLPPLILASTLFLMIYDSTGSILHSGYGFVLVLSAGSIMIEVPGLVLKWRERIEERYSIVLLMLVVGIFAFYVYYAWTEVYMSELIVPSAMIGGLFLWILFKPHEVSITRSVRRMGGKLPALRRTIRRTIIPDRTALILFVSALIISVPVSIGVFAQDNFFQQDPMDQRPTMQTIMEVADWIQDNSGKDDNILAWHHFAVQAHRRTIIEPSNAHRLNPIPVIEDMVYKNVSVFVRDYYTTVVLWTEQPLFQQFINDYYHLDTVIDGNECWLRNEGQSKNMNRDDIITILYKEK